MWLWCKERLVYHKKENTKIKQNEYELKEKLKYLEETLLQKKKNIKNGTNNKKNLCPICKIRKRNIIILTCGHTFCSDCIHLKSSCLFCKSNFTETDLHQINWK